jgi:hypothetical protein
MEGENDWTPTSRLYECLEPGVFFESAHFPFPDPQTTTVPVKIFRMIVPARCKLMKRYARALWTSHNEV